MMLVPWGLVAGYLLVDVVMGIGIFRWFYAIKQGVGTGIYEGFSAQAVSIGVWGRAALLVVLFVVFLRVPDAVTRASPGGRLTARRTPAARGAPPE
jgi:hypothetical protein